MNESYMAAVYWPGRRESAEESARRAEAFFRLLLQADSVFAQWFEQADTLEEALQLQFEPSYETLVRFFEGKYRFDDDGVSFGAWTGQPEHGHGSMLMLGAGSIAEFSPNTCLLYLPSEDPEAGRVRTVPVLSAILRAMVLAWEPDWGFAGPRDLRDELRQEEDKREPVGWLTYFSAQRSPLPPLPDPVRIEPVEDKGTLVILTPERLSTANPEHVALARRVQAVLDERDLLAPIIARRPRASQAPS